MDKITHDVRAARWLDIIHQCQTRTDGTTAHQWLANHGVKEKLIITGYASSVRKHMQNSLIQKKNLPFSQPLR